MNIISCMFSKKYDEDLGVWNNFPPYARVLNGRYKC